MSSIFKKPIRRYEINDSRMYERYRIFWIWEMNAYYWMVCCQNVSHPAGNMPSMACLVLGWFRWGTPFISVLFRSCFGPVLVSGLWAASGRSWLITCRENDNIYTCTCYDCFRGRIDGSHLDMIQHISWTRQPRVRGTPIPSSIVARVKSVFIARGIVK